jgi:hypothetical protein
MWNAPRSRSIFCFWDTFGIGPGSPRKTGNAQPLSEVVHVAERTNWIAIGEMAAAERVSMPHKWAAI